MAEIQVERKGPSMWPWIIGLIVIALLIWALASLFTDDDDLAVEPVIEEPVATAPAVGTALPSEVEAFRTWVQRDTGTMGLSHAYTASGITAMLDGLAAVVEQNPTTSSEVQNSFTRLRGMAEQLRANPQSTQHANMVREIFITTAMVMEGLQRELYTTLSGEVAPVRQAAEAVSAERPLLEQREAVHTFFQRAADALTAMARAPAA